MSEAGAERTEGNGGEHEGRGRDGGVQQAVRETAEGARGQAEDRAEELLDALGQRVGAISAFAAFSLRKYAARAREEIEDIWAEAQQLRRDHRS